MNAHSKNQSSDSESKESSYAWLKHKAQTYYAKSKRYITKNFKSINLTSIKDIALIIIALVAIRVSYQQNTISEHSMKVSNRPYLVIDRINSHNEFLIDNYGKTPSFKTKIFYDMAIDSSNDFVPLEVYRDSIVIFSTIGTILQKSIEMPNVAVNNPRANNFAYCYGKIIYSDIFDDWHGYRFCFRPEYGAWQKYKEYNYQFEIN